MFVKTSAQAIGTTVAVATVMTSKLSETPLTMPCPRCARPAVEAAPDSSPVIAWFTCPACGCDWSARLRDGRPATIVDLPMSDLSLRSSPAGPALEVASVKPSKPSASGELVALS
jgi:hypothetical protein